MGQTVRIRTKTRTRTRKTGGNTGYRQCNVCHGSGKIKIKKKG